MTFCNRLGSKKKCRHVFGWLVHCQYTKLINMKQEEKQPIVSITIIHYNTPQYLKTCLDSIFNQTYKNIEVYFIDNNSPDKSGLNFVIREYKDRKNLKIIPNKENLGYAKAANQGIKLAIEHENKADYVVITNPDIIYTKSYFEKIVSRIEKDENIAAITGKVYKYDFDNKKKTNIIDTVGLFAYKNRRIIDRGQGLEDKGQFDEEKEVFGVSGACPLYRREALKDVKILGEYFDEDFFMYKEDVDLSWRFLLYGWNNFYFPKAVAYHGRGTGVFKRFTNKEVLSHRGKLSKFQKKYSFKNQRLMQAKNELWGTFFADFGTIMLRKILMPFYITFREPYLWKSYLDYVKQLPSALKKRRIIMKNRRASAKEMKKWFKKPKILR
ncbi:glycosyltransferase [Candidatus Peregrinibacteria bacterium]|nr:glycosyltransferase [Candidatus Peregrinibacteria bacterium]